MIPAGTYGPGHGYPRGRRAFASGPSRTGQPGEALTERAPAGDRVSGLDDDAGVLEVRAPGASSSI